MLRKDVLLEGFHKPAAGIAPRRWPQHPNANNFSRCDLNHCPPNRRLARSPGLRSSGQNMPHHFDKSRHDVATLRLPNSRPHSDPKRVVHELVGIPEFADDSKFNVSKGRLASEVSSEQQPRTYFLFLKIRDNIPPL